MIETQSKSIWYDKSLTKENLPGFTKNTLGPHLGMELEDFGPDFLSIRMPVDERTHQPYGLLHGGASVALAETAGSIASHYCIDNKKFYAVGLEINANHVKGVRSGFVIGTATPLHLGRSTHVWDIKIRAENGDLVCVSRLTVAILAL